MKLDRIYSLTLAAALTVTGIAASGCGNTDSTVGTMPNSGTGMTGVGDGGKQVTGPTKDLYGPDSGKGAGGAPPFGEYAGNGFSTGDAPHAGGTGSGLMGWHGTGSQGTSMAISDKHDAGKMPEGGGPKWVLPEQ